MWKKPVAFVIAIFFAFPPVMSAQLDSISTNPQAELPKEKYFDLFTPQHDRPLPFWLWAEGALGFASTSWGFYGDIGGGFAIQQFVATLSLVSLGIDGSKWGGSSINSLNIMAGYTFLRNQWLITYGVVGISSYRYRLDRYANGQLGQMNYSTNAEGTGVSLELGAKVGLFCLGAGFSLAANINSHFSYLAFKVCLQLGWLPNQVPFQ